MHRPLGEHAQHEEIERPAEDVGLGLRHWLLLSRSDRRCVHFCRKSTGAGQASSAASMRRSGTSQMSATVTKITSEIAWCTNASGIAAA